ncbi:MAG: holo-ACP synthase [Deltaproteobacteria bacterium]|nr:holo-ACP synthase [Deltaproteobacteria bacterium]
MILGIGIDVCPVERMRDVLARHGDLFKKRVFTDRELERAGEGRVSTERLAARFAAKEAAIKALRAPAGLVWKDLEVVSATDGAPALALHGRAAEAASAMGVVRQTLSLSHAGGIAVAVVVLEGGA